MEKVKIFIITIISAISSFLGILAIPVFALIFLNIIDYITGIVASTNCNEKVDSYKGIKGIFKKICMLLLVAIAAIMDWVLMFATVTVGINAEFQFVVATIVAVWLILNEMLSIFENMVDIGVELPPFLQKIAKYVKTQTENKGDIK